MSTNSEANQPHETKTAEVQTSRLEQSILPNLLSYIGAFLIFIGALKLIIYYRFFNISIIQFLTLGEIVISWLDELIIFIVTFIIAFIVSFPIGNSDQGKATNILHFENSKNIFSRVWETVLVFRFAHLIFLVVILFDLLLACMSKTPFFFFWLVLALWIVVVLLFYVYFVFKKLIFESNVKNKLVLMMLTIAALYITFFSFAIPLAKYGKVKYHKENSGVKIILDDKIMLLSDSQNYFVGKTDNYIFFHHELTNTTDVYPIGVVREIIFAPNKNNPYHKK